MLIQFVDEIGTGMLFGYPSFKGTDETAYFDMFSMLKGRYLAPKRWLPWVKAPNVFRDGTLGHRNADPKRGLRLMPPLLRTYLTMGGWVSDHAAVDHNLKTFHAFMRPAIAAVPPARASFAGCGVRAPLTLTLPLWPPNSAPWHVYPFYK